MPSQTHEALALLFRECPNLGAVLARDSLGVDLATGAAEAVSAEFADLDPAEYRADAVLRVAGPEGQPGDVLIIEVQLRSDPDKAFTWPLYAAGARQRFRCPTTVVVVTPDERVATWAGQTVSVDRAGSRFRALAIGPAKVPSITDADAAGALPELAVLSAVMHGHDADAADIGAAALAACQRLDDSRARIYADIILDSLGDVARTALEKLMDLRGYQYPQSDFAKKHYSEGRAEERRELLQRLLTRKFGSLPADVVQRLEDAAPEDLLRWSDRLVEAESLDAVFA